MDRTYQINEFSVTRTTRRRQRIGGTILKAIVLIAAVAFVVWK
jgi:hypothetical protein